jgi:hypothetical protein
MGLVNAHQVRALWCDTRQWETICSANKISPGFRFFYTYETQTLCTGGYCLRYALCAIRVVACRPVSTYVSSVISEGADAAHHLSRATCRGLKSDIVTLLRSFELHQHKQ